MLKKIRKFLRRVFGIQQTLYLLAILGVLLPALVVFPMLMQRLQHEATAQQNQINATRMNQLLPALRVNLWNLNRAGVIQATQLALQDPGVIQIRVYTQQSALPYHSVGKTTPAGSGPLLEVSQDIIERGEKLGHVVLLVQRGLANSLWYELTYWGMPLVVVQLILTVSLVSLGLHWRVLHPLHRLSNQAQRIGNLDLLERPNWLPYDAFGRLGIRLNAMSEKLQGLFAEVTERKRAMEFLALFDPLTGLPNRTMLRELSQASIAEAARSGRRFAVLFIDLDGFKHVNDSLGHSVGDELLRQVAARLRVALRNADRVGRQGGDEFIVVSGEIRNWDEATYIAERIIDAVGQPYELAGQPVHVTPSIGVTIFPDDGEDYDTLVKNADAAMYKAKERGKNAFQFFTADMNQSAHETLKIESQLLHALERKQFMLYYQPIIEVASGRCVALEALLRWKHPELGLLSPTNFMHVAEERGLIMPIGNWVIAEACRQMADWRDKGRTLVPLAVNVSLVQFRMQQLAHTIHEAILRHQISPRQFSIEMTESSLMQDVEATIATVEALRGIGISFAVDDFGTGYSSLASLKRFKPNKLKIDRSFVRDIPRDVDDVQMTTAILDLARSLNIEAVAEGVETPEQLEFLRREGCALAQGYHFSPPLPPDDLLAWLDKNADLPVV
ncbi:putative bifunctional diguanylate cyclase/phosphodiesterase [Parvibium lacunae]|uniref:EAL domain-containing protein n=1 Tax=Parvibium lacunae TaxID=1888893 RepID=A0A368L3W9_9BURK|nr:EAL domain-containing protein [Parvibium lacunae]RCS58278.1 EAL domain-containing protein [Parvibium lacunae]